MKRLPFLSLVAFILAGCVSAQSAIEPQLAHKIPDQANLIKLSSSQSPSAYYDVLYKDLARRGYEIAESDDERFTLSTAPKQTKQQTTLAVRLFVEKSGSGSVALMRGRWGMSGSMAAGMSAAFGAGMDKNVGEPAVWKPRNRAGVAFGAMAQLANELPSDSLAYEVE